MNQKAKQNKMAVTQDDTKSNNVDKQ